ncbi:Basic amino-acid permease [Orbilia blumenaviensis]|uniref:Basic amino-acid permease n=1 Tax=Orbilia blumenaviensis TaxID=1796055 RepID=A0AAV9UP18_9PEZI
MRCHLPQGPNDKHKSLGTNDKFMEAGLDERASTSQNKTINKRGAPRLKYRRTISSPENGQHPSIERIDDAPADLQYLSMPPGLRMSQMHGIFWQWKQAGKGVTVYVLDTGCDWRHPEFKNTKFGGWIFPGPSVLMEPRDDTATPWSWDFHGTGVVAKIVGERSGVARHATVVVAKSITGGSREGPGHDLYQDHELLLKIYDHVKRNNPEGNAKCIINISFKWSEIAGLRALSVDWALRIELYSRSNMIKLSLLVISSLPSPGQPADLEEDLLLVHAKRPELKNRMVVVGGHDFHFKNVGNYGKHVGISAVAVNLRIAQGYSLAEDPYFGRNKPGRWDSRAWKRGGGTSYCKSAKISADTSIRIRQQALGCLSPHND